MPHTVKNQASVDLTNIGPEELADIDQIKNVALLVAKRSQASALSRIPTKNVAKTVYIPDDTHASLMTGLVERGGESFDAPHLGNQVLFITGALVITSPLTQSKYREIHVTGGILAPRGSEDALGKAITSLTGGMVYYKYAEGQQIKPLSGSTMMSAESLANAQGTANDILVVAGQLIVTGRVESLGFGEILVSGQCIAPRNSEPVLAPALTIQGQMLWYNGDNPRFFTGSERFGPDFFEYIDDKLALVLIGDHTIESGVTADTLKQKISDITLLGNLTAPKELLGILQFLTAEKHGQIVDASDIG